MIKLSKPRVGLFIAMDGVAPVAKVAHFNEGLPRMCVFLKMQQQRIRRYRAVEMKKMSKTRFSKLLEYLVTEFSNRNFGRTDISERKNCICDPKFLWVKVLTWVQSVAS